MHYQKIMGPEKHARSSSNEAAKKKTQQRVRITNKGLEAQRFSTVRMPAKSEAVSSASQMHAPEKSIAFDPIPQDGMFNIVESSSYWPPEPLESLLGSGSGSGDATQLSADGMDMYDRRADDADAKKEKMKVAKQIKLAGELSHPRGKGTKNVKVNLGDDSD